MNLLITGGTGFIGKQVVSRALNMGCRVFSLQRNTGVFGNDVEVVIADLTEPASYMPKIVDLDIDACIHLAWSGIPDLGKFNSILNVRNSNRFIDFLLSNTSCRKVVSTGSCLEYQASGDQITEGTNDLGESHFAWAKNSIYRFGTATANLENKSFSWLRLFYVYGHGQREGSLIPTAMSSCINKTDLSLRHPHVRNDYVHVSDVAKAVVLATTIEFSGVYNIGSGCSESALSICRLVERELNGNTLITDKYGEPSSENTNDGFCADISHTCSELNWKPSVDLKTGIKSCLESKEIEF
jgi:nucleoside-diphosphate-sugar epimerase